MAFQSLTATAGIKFVPPTNHALGQWASVEIYDQTETGEKRRTVIEMSDEQWSALGEEINHYLAVAAEKTLVGIPVRVSAGLPPDEVLLVQNGKIVGRITNIGEGMG